MQPHQPSDLHPEFTPERLIHIAGVIRRARRAVITDVYNSQLDSRWSIGCLAFQRIANTIVLNSKEETVTTWLGVVTNGLHFVFSIGGVPVRFYRGAFDKPAPTGQTQLNEHELRAFQLAFEGMLTRESKDRCFRILYETDNETLLVSRIYFVELDKHTNEVVFAWRIPGDENDQALPITTGDAPIDLPPASVELVKKIIAAEEAELGA